MYYTIVFHLSVTQTVSADARILWPGAKVIVKSASQLV